MIRNHIMYMFLVNYINYLLDLKKNRSSFVPIAILHENYV